MEDKIIKLEKAVQYLAEELDRAYRTINRINDNYDESNYKNIEAVNEILELPN